MGYKHLKNLVCDARARACKTGAVVASENASRKLYTKWSGPTGTIHIHLLHTGSQLPFLGSLPPCRVPLPLGVPPPCRVLLSCGSIYTMRAGPTIIRNPTIPCRVQPPCLDPLPCRSHYQLGSHHQADLAKSHRSTVPIRRHDINPSTDPPNKLYGIEFNISKQIMRFKKPRDIRVNFAFIALEHHQFVPTGGPALVTWLWSCDRQAGHVTAVACWFFNVSYIWHVERSARISAASFRNIITPSTWQWALDVY